jgi:hypothetical protein
MPILGSWKALISTSNSKINTIIGDDASSPLMLITMVEGVDLGKTAAA